MHSLDRPFLAVADGHLHLELLRGFVEQQNAERAVVDEALGEAGDTRQQHVEIENRRHLAADFGQRFERVDVLALGLEQPRVLDRHRDVRGKLPQQRLVLTGEGVGRLAEQVQRADDVTLAPHRHRELRQHVAKRPLIARLAANVVDENRAPLLDRGADHALSRPEAAACASASSG